MTSYKYILTIPSDPAFGEAFFDYSVLRTQMLAYFPEPEVNAWFTDLTKTGSATFNAGTGTIQVTSHPIH